MDTQRDLPAGPATAVFFSFSGVPEVATGPRFQWAIGELRTRLGERGMTLQPMESASPDRRKGTEIRIALSRDEASSQSAARGGIELPGTPESFAIFRVPEEDVDRLYVYGADMRGLIYALTELADRVRYGANVLTELEFAAPLLETPTAKVRSISKCFVSEIEDLPWFHDREGWEDYLTALATHRFNRFSLTFGMQYNYPYGNEFMSDVYLHLAYPFLVSVPGYAVSISNLSEEERRQNLETLQFIGCEANRRGLDFQLALWTQSYDFDDCPNAKHQIAGLGPDNIALYCRDALALLLKEVPQISGLTLRVHVECGIPEGDYDFWRIYFEAVKGAGRPIRLDLHAKGIDDEMIDVALATGMPVGISPKYTSEHLGLPYHQTSIRALEMPPRDDMPAAAGRDMTTLYSGEDAERHARKWRFSEGSRKFMRYSYGDLLRENRPYAIMFRIWPGTTRILLWGDPALAGGYGRNATFCGAEGIELCEPLSFKGRMGTGIAGSRTGYRGKYRLFRHDWQKFEYTYRVWGRSLFDPEADPQVFRRFLVSKYGEAGDTCGRALASASRILPLITLAHTPTASNNSYWPEMYENMSLVHAAPQLPYGYELPRPSRFGTVGSCDPQLFMSPAEFASCLHEDRGVDRIAPLTWANWLERLALEASTKMAHALSASGDPGDELFLVSVDVTILASIGRFFAAKVRAATFWEYFLLSGDEDSARLALGHYRRARNTWAEAAKVCRDVYLPDSTYGPHSWLRGRWDDRLPAIERDIADMEAMISQSAQRPASEPDMHHLQRIGDWQASQVFGCRHTPPEGFAHGEAVEISLIPPGESHQEIILHYRHVDQSQPWCRIAMTWQDGAYRAIIPAGYTDAPFPLQYYFEIRDSDVSAFHPGLGEDLTGTPYFVLEGRRA